ncbi:MAG: hypothetical protein QHH07_08495 [Sedimentisphaerales bacterium]|nr:hypothetical protein [Sedimentisphaerales bacterium]
MPHILGIERTSTCHGMGSLPTPSRKPPRGPYRTSMVKELMATMTNVSPSLPLARYPQTRTMAVQGAMPSNMDPAR